jgi:quercetin dioxygenase-like cupin family protein
MKEGTFPSTNRDRARLLEASSELKTQTKNSMKKTFIKLIGATGLLQFVARAKNNAALVEAHISKRRMKFGMVSAIALALVGATVAIILPARATPQSGVSSVTLAHGSFDEIDIFAKTDLDPGNRTDYWKAMINTKGASHLYVLQNTVLPGGSFGWHSHTGPSLIIVMSGVATEYEGNDPTCTPRVHPAGTTFVDAGETSGHLVRNDGSVNLVVTVVRLVPEGAVQRVDLPNPGNCPGVN